MEGIEEGGAIECKGSAFGVEGKGVVVAVNGARVAFSWRYWSASFSISSVMFNLKVFSDA